MSFSVQFQATEVPSFIPEGVEESSEELSTTPPANSNGFKTAPNKYVKVSHFQGSNNKESSPYNLTNKSQTVAAGAYPRVHTAATGKFQTQQGIKANTFSPLQNGPVQSRPRVASMQNCQRAATESTKIATPSLSTSGSATSLKHAGHRVPVTANKSESTRETREKRSENREGLSSRRFSKEETQKWWEGRYTERERGNKQGREQNQEQEKQEGKEGKKVGKVTGVQVECAASLNNGASHERSQRRVSKPELTSPKIGVFALYFILTKIGIASDGAADFAYKGEIESLDQETTVVHKKRLDEIREAINKEEENARWSIAAKAFSWIGSLLGLIAGIVLVATGVGVVV